MKNIFKRIWNYLYQIFKETVYIVVCTTEEAVDVVDRTFPSSAKAIDYLMTLPEAGRSSYTVSCCGDAYTLALNYKRNTDVHVYGFLKDALNAVEAAKNEARRNTAHSFVREGHTLFEYADCTRSNLVRRWEIVEKAI